MGKTKIISLLLIPFLFLFLAKQTLAVKFDLIPPSGDLERGQEIQFVINIDSQGATINSADIGMTYDTQYLEYINTVPGDAMESVSVSDQGGGKLLFSGNNSVGFSGQGVFATVTLKIIASSSGSTELCVLWAPTVTPTSPPSQPTSPPSQPTSPPAPTSLPRTGNSNNTKFAGLFGLAFLSIATGFYFFNRKVT